jgi:MerR family transcriptional regulator, redox-sensitive transcriptional activator SoxR
MDCNADLMASDELINIREMSERSFVLASTLRYYQKFGLITPERETSGSHRSYRKATFHRIIYITLAQTAGFNHEEIAEKTVHPAGYPSVTAEGREPLRKIWERRIDQRIAESSN